MIHNRVPASLAVIGCVLLVAATRPAAAQFLWAETSTTPKPTFRLTFGEAAGESTPASLLERIQKARTWTADGKTLDLKPGDGVLLAALPTGVRSAGAEQTWGVLDRRPQGRGLFLLRYYAKAAQDATAAASSLKLPVEVFVGRAGAVWVATVRHNDQPVAGAEVWVARPGNSTPLELKTDGAGEVRFAVEQAGTCQIRAMVPELTPGRHEEKAYDLVQHYSTLTFPAVAATDAAGVIQAAQSLRETWDARFPGFTARLRIERNGKSAEGTLAVSAARLVEVKLGDPDLQSSAQHLLQMMIARRAAPGSPNYQPSFAPADRHPQGRAIRLNDSNQSWYRIADGQLRQISRILGNSRFTMDVLRNTLVEGGRYLPAEYTVTYRDARTGALQRVESFSESFQRVGGYFLPLERRVISAGHDATSVTVLTLREPQLNPPALSARE